MLVVPGRALLLQTKWLRDEKITVLGVYAPNVTRTDGAESAAFWKSIEDFYSQHPSTPRPNILAGDCNVVEDAIDRLPMASDPLNAREALSDLKSKLGLMDGWRHTFPSTKAFTFVNYSTSSQSRLDRIYTSQSVFASAREWVIAPLGIPHTDHMMVSVKVTSGEAPKMGRGRWVMPKHVLRDRLSMDYARDEGLAAMKKIDRLLQSGERDPDNNAQTIYMNFKRKLYTFARRRQREIVPKLVRELIAAQTEVRETLEDITRAEREIIPEDEDAIAKNEELLAAKRKKAAVATEKVAQLEAKRHLKTRQDSATKNRLEGETMSKYWFQTGKAAKPRDMIYALRKPEGWADNTSEEYEKDSAKMAELARNYHETLQSVGSRNESPERDKLIAELLNQVETAPSDQNWTKLNSRLTREDIAGALASSDVESSPGLDGATYELRKTIDERCEADLDDNLEGFDGLELIVQVALDITDHGKVAGSDFADGWMCPIYKKNDKNEISNYRPITCLNTDYKLVTKALSNKLALAAPELIHENQAEASGQNGLIVALDQEKAYDKIDHKYLWKVLEAFQIPNTFINLVKNLYSGAATQVMINGLLSSSYEVTRGFRQGDPLSCLVFDLAIEPLAISLRNSELAGFQIPTMNKKVIANLFADDTTVFLSATDQYSELTAMLDRWCEASTAKFNVSKTEIIPIGTEEYRQGVIATRTTAPGTDPIPDHIHIVPEGEAVRILGAWYGNHTDDEQPWSLVIDKIDAALERWERTHPTMEGQKLLSQSIVGGMTQYLTQVQGMPKDVEKSLSKKIVKFLWADKSLSPVRSDNLFAPIEMGGRGLLDLEARNEAIQIMWLKRYLSYEDNRPIWAFVAYELKAITAPKSEERAPIELKFNVFLQSWKPSMSSRGALPKDLRQMLNVGTKHEVRPEGLAFTRDIIRKRPIWFHNEARPTTARAHLKTRCPNTSEASCCLVQNHGITTVGETEDLARALDNIEHLCSRSCNCDECSDHREYSQCEFPGACFKRAKELLDELPEKWNPLRVQPEDIEEAWEGSEANRENDIETFDPRTTTRGPLGDIFRVFTEGKSTGETWKAVWETPDEPGMECVATDGACDKNGDANATAGAGVFFGQSDPRNRSIKLPDSLEQSNQSGELFAVKVAVEVSNQARPLRIESDSKYSINQLMSNLQKSEDQGYIGMAHESLIKATMARLRKGKAKPSFNGLKAIMVTYVMKVRITKQGEVLRRLTRTPWS